MAAIEQDTGGYVTRGRAAELFRRQEELEQRLEAVEQTVAQQQELLRRRLALDIEFFRSTATGRKGPPT